MTISISVVICTRNRASYLQEALASLAIQTLPSDAFEILVVDNASTDTTQQVIEQEFNRLPNLRSVHEPTLGLNYARNAGWKSALGEFVAYLDDDGIAAPDWLERILDVYREVSPRPGCVGGKIVPIWEAPRPVWLADELATHLAIFDWSTTPILTFEDALLAGVNLSIPKALIEQVGGFAPQLDRQGSNLLSNGDVLLQLQLQRAGYACYYDPAICVQHHIQASRLTQRWFEERFYWQGVSDARMWIILNRPTLHRRLIDIRDIARKFYRDPGRFLRSNRATQDPGVFAQRCQYKAALGYLRGMLLYRALSDNGFRK
ncbi:MAG: glycosyl transferase family 2 [Chloroflexi bacterium]|nr:glycosyl transferase family 2 [Chloroflexota bacterium]